MSNGDPYAPIRLAQGVVAMNSTVGMISPESTRMTAAPGDAINGRSGLALQGGREALWMALVAPGTDLCACIRRAAMSVVRVNGGLHCGKCIALSVESSARMLTTERPSSGGLP